MCVCSWCLVWHADAIVKRAHSLLALYDEAGVKRDKLIFRVPATWAGIQAAGQLEKEGIATQAFHIYRYACAAQFTGGLEEQPGQTTNNSCQYEWYKLHHIEPESRCDGCSHTHIFVLCLRVCSFVQGVAAAQAGVSVVQPNVGRTRDWYNKHPGVIRDPHVSDAVEQCCTCTLQRLLPVCYTSCAMQSPEYCLQFAGNISCRVEQSWLCDCACRHH